MDIQQLQREFRYNGVVLVDPNQVFTLHQVRDFYANVYPEILSADIEGPEQLGAKVVYTFRRAVGTKGCDQVRLRQEPVNRGRVDDLSKLLGAKYFTPGEEALIKENQLLIHAGRIGECDIADLSQLKILWAKHCKPQMAAA